MAKNSNTTNIISLVENILNCNNIATNDFEFYICPNGTQLYDGIETPYCLIVEGKLYFYIFDLEGNMMHKIYTNRPFLELVFEIGWIIGYIFVRNENLNFIKED